MQYLTFLLPKIQLLGDWVYWIILLICVLESTVLVGLLVPGTAVLIVAGFLSSQGILDFDVLVWVAIFGGIIGDYLSFYLGGRGTNLFKTESKLLKLSHLESGASFFKRHGDKSIVLSRFVGPLRPIVPFIAGLFKMPRNKFMLYNIISGVLSALAYLSFGYFFGSVWEQVQHVLGKYEAVIIIIGIVLAAWYFWQQKLNKK